MHHIFKAALGAAAILALSTTASATVIYDTTPSPVPSNVVSLGYEATSTSEFGDRIAFAGTQRQLTAVTVTMSDWANYADYPSMSASGWTHPLTLNLYNVALGGTVGALIYSQTVNASIPWHDILGATPLTGTAFNVVFTLPNVIVPDGIIFGLAYNTQHYGAAPIGTSGPYNSLNFGLSTVLPSVGTDFNTDSVFWNTSFAGFLTSGGPGVAGTFSEDTAWSPYRPAIKFEADPVPEPATIATVLSMLLLSAYVAMKRRASLQK